MKRFALFAILLISFACLADDAGAAPQKVDWLAGLGKIAADLLPIISGAIALLGGWALKKLSTKLHLDGVINSQAIVDDAVQKGIGYAEAWAAKQAKDGDKPTGSEKLDVALKFTSQILENAKVQAYAKEHLAKLVEHFLQEEPAQ